MSDSIDITSKCYNVNFNASGKVWWEARWTNEFSVLPTDRLIMKIANIMIQIPDFWLHIDRMSDVWNGVGQSKRFNPAKYNPIILPIFNN